MKGITVRVSDDIHALLKQEADRVGIGLNAYIREAACTRAIIARAHRGHYTNAEAVDKAVRDYLVTRER